MLLLCSLISFTAKPQKQLHLDKKNKSCAIMPAPISIKEAIDSAYQNRSIISAREYQIKQKQYEQRKELTGYFPQFRFYTTIARSKDNKQPKNQYNAELKQLIYNAAGPIERYKIARNNTNIAQWAKEQELQNIQFNVEKSILDLWQTQLKSNAIMALQNSSRATIAQAQQNLLIGNLAEPDWAQEVATFAQATSDVTSYEDQLRTAWYSLERAIEMPAPPTINPLAIEHLIATSLDQAATYPLEYFTQMAQKYNPILWIKDEEIEREKRLEAIYARSYVPTVSMVAWVVDLNFKNSDCSTTNTTSTQLLTNTFSAASGLFNSGINTRNSNTWFVGLELGWTFDSLGNFFASRAAQSSQAYYIMDKINTGLDINLDVQTTYHNLQQQLKQVDATRVQLEQARAEFERAQHKLSIGEISPIDFAQAQTTWENAQFALAQQETQTTTAYRELLFKCGYPPTTERMRVS